MEAKINAHMADAEKTQEFFEKRSEVFEKVKAAESAEKVLALAKEVGEELSMEEAQGIYKQFHSTGELLDEELQAVAGGGEHKYGHLVVSMFYSCGDWVCGKHNGNCSCKKAFCTQCMHVRYKFPVMICNIH